MKISVFTFLFAGLAVSTTWAGNLVTLTSSDGSKTMQAAIEEYHPSNGTARIFVNGRRMNVPVTAFQTSDKAKFENWHDAQVAGRQLLLTFADYTTGNTEKKTSNAKVSTADTGYRIQVRNNAKTDLEGVEVRYRIFYYHDQDKGGKKAAHTDGSHSLTKISPRETQEFQTATVTLTRQRPLPASQCKGGS